MGFRQDGSGKRQSNRGVGCVVVYWRVRVGTNARGRSLSDGDGVAINTAESYTV